MKGNPKGKERVVWSVLCIPKVVAAQLRLDAEQLMSLALHLIPLAEHDVTFALIARDNAGEGLTFQQNNDSKFKSQHVWVNSASHAHVGATIRA